MPPDVRRPARGKPLTLASLDLESLFLVSLSTLSLVTNAWYTARRPLAYNVRARPVISFTVVHRYIGDSRERESPREVEA